MSSTNVTVRIDDNLKSQLQELVSNLGMDMTTFFIMTAKQAVRMQALPFRPEMEPFNYETWKAKWEVEFMQAHPEIPWKTYSDVGMMFEEVLSEDDV